MSAFATRANSRLPLGLIAAKFNHYQAELPGLTPRMIERPLLPGPGASPAWCRANLAPLRGDSEQTHLPVGLGLNALRYGLKRLRWATARGINVPKPIEFVTRYAKKVARGEVTEIVSAH